MDAINLALHVLTSTWAIPACAFGVAWGILGGALPGISPSITMALILPFTYAIDAPTAVIMLASTYVGAEYGGSIPAILISTPGTNSASATLLDGYAMQRQGKGGEALGISLMTGWIGGLFGLLVLVFLTGWLTNVALLFKPPAYFAIGLLGLSVIASLSADSLIKGLIPGVLGLMIATVGTDPFSGVNRYTFDLPDLIGGIEPVIIMIGLFAVSELLVQSGLPAWPKAESRMKIILPKWSVLFGRLRVAQIIGCIVGTFEGIMPGAGGTVSAFISYNETRRWSKHPEEFGHGSIEGVAAPECANNVVTATTLIPVLAFGIPGSNSAAILMGGLLLHGIRPGPAIFASSPDVVYGLYGGLFVANMFMLLIGYFTLRPCVYLVNRPKPYVLAFIYVLLFSGTYSLEHSLFEPALVLAMGVVGYLMRYIGLNPLPMVLGVVLGFMVETNFRRSLIMSMGDYGIFWADPISAGLLAVALLFILGSLSRIALNRYKAYKAKSGEAGA